MHFCWASDFGARRIHSKGKLSHISQRSTEINNCTYNKNDGEQDGGVSAAYVRYYGFPCAYNTY